jgi:hypothetical protein
MPLYKIYLSLSHSSLTQPFFFKNSYTKFHVNATNGSVTDVIVYTRADRCVLNIRCHFSLYKELLKNDSSRTALGLCMGQ